MFDIKSTIIYNNYVTIICRNN